MTKLLVLTYSNYWNLCCENYKTSLEKFGYKNYTKENYDYYQATYAFIGDGEKWEGYMTKIKGYYNFLVNLKEVTSQAKDDFLLVAITDAHDVLCVDYYYNTINSFIHNYDKNKVVFAGERNCHQIKCIPLKEYWKKKFINVDIPNKYLNSGWFIGQISNMITVLHYCIYDLYVKKGITDDQLACCIYANANQDKIELDYTGRFVSTIVNVDEYMSLEYEEKKEGVLRLHNKGTNQYPSFIHATSHCSDFYYRLDVIGRKIIGDAYIITDFFTKIKSIWGSVQKNDMYRTPIILGLIILAILFYKVKKFRIITILLLGYFALFYNYKVYHTNSLDVMDYIS